MSGTATRPNESIGSRESDRRFVWEGLAVLSAGLGLAPHIRWIGFVFAALGVCLVVSSWSLQRWSLRPTEQVANPPCANGLDHRDGPTWKP